MKILSSYDQRMGKYRKKIITNPQLTQSCIYCHSQKNLVPDVGNKNVYYCLECLSKSLLHDEWISEGYESEPDVL